MQDKQSYLKAAVDSFQGGNLALSESTLVEAIKQWPGDAQLHSHLGVVLKALSKNELAMNACNRATELEPSLPTPYYTRGNIYRSIGKHQHAISEFAQCIELDTSYADAHMNMGLSYRELGKSEEAIACLRSAVRARPQYAMAHCNLALSLQAQGKLEEALDSYNRSIDLNTRYPEALAARASCLADMGNYDAAIKSARLAIEMRPNFAEALNNVGTYYRQQGLHSEAIKSFEAAIEINPNHSNARYNLSLSLLLTGDLKKGFREYEERYSPRRKVRDKPILPPLPAPRWMGEPLEGKTILIWHEQGAGDGIQTVRFAKRLGELGAKVWLATLPSLLTLMQSAPELTKVFSRQDISQVAGYDYWVMSFSLAHLLDYDIKTLPVQVPYLGAQPDKVEKFKEIIQVIEHKESKTPIVGLVWTGNPDHTNDRYRSTTLQALRPILEMQGVTWVSLQKGASENDPAPGGVEILRLHQHLNDFGDTAAALKCIDMLITVDTSLAHLAGALNVPAIVMLAANPDWRWMLGTDASPWYPSLELARQTRLGEWADAVLQVRERLGRKLGRPYSKELIELVPKSRPDTQVAAEAVTNAVPRPTAQSEQVAQTAQTSTQSAAQKINEAKSLFKQGNIDLARSLLGQVLEEIKEQPDALYELGRICFSKGEYQEACNYFERALKGLANLSQEQRPNFEGPWARDLGVAYQRLGKESAAVAVFYRSQVLRPDVSVGKYLNTYWTKTAGVKLKEAIGLHKSGKEKDAQKIYEEILKKDPSNGEALHFMGCILLSRKEFQQAEELLRRAIKLNPASAVYHRNLAALYVRTKRPDEALRLWRHALTLDTIDEGGINEVANALVEHGAYQDAVAAYKKALEKNPSSARTLSNLGRAYTLVKSDDDAKEYLVKAMELDAKLLDPPLILARIAVDQGNYEEARAYLAVTKKISPSHPYVVWSEAFIGLGIYYDSQAQSNAQMADFVERMKVLEKYLSKANMSEIENGVGYRQPYEIAYFDQNNKRWLAAYGGAICSGMKRWQKEHNIPVPKARVIEGPIRVGIVMGFFFNHSVWNALVKGWMMASPKQDIEFHAFYTRPIVDKETERAKHYATAFHPAPKVLKDWAQTISDSKCDVLIYPEIGMEPVTLKLAAMRLAPVQVGSWGHAEGTGLPTIDYYLTGDLIEPANAQDNYSEKIVRLPNLGCYVEPWAVTPEEINPQEFGLDAARPWLVCPGSPYKYRPEHDQLWLNVAKRLPNAQLLFFLHTRRAGTSNRIRGRLERLFEQEGMDLNNHAVFLPWLTANRFFGIMKRSTVFLDTIGFSGFNTAQQGIECGLPIVTIEGKYMRGMLASGLLRRIGATDTIVSSQEEYIECASRLVEDPQFAESVRAKMASGIQAIYRDQSAMDGFVDFIKSVTNYQKGEPIKTLVSKSKAKDKVNEQVKLVSQGEVKGRVTVAIPAYNLQFFEQALASAQQQDYANLEILVSDDSSDNRIQDITLKRCETDTRIRYIKNEKNLGFFGNFTQCYKLASGEYIKYLNDDDLLMPGCVSVMVKGFEIDEKIKLVFSKRNRIDESGKVLNYAGPEIKSDKNTRIKGFELGDLILQKSLNLIGEPTTAMFRKGELTLEDDNIFSWAGREYHCFADVCIWLRLLSKGDAYYFNDCLTSYRVHKGQEQRKPEVSLKCITERYYILKPAQTLKFLQSENKYSEALDSYEKILKNYSNLQNIELNNIKEEIQKIKNKR
jgi:protein O-GlcNAc transferase